MAADKPGPPFCAIPAEPGWTGRIAAGFVPADVWEKGAVPGEAGTHAEHTGRVVALRSKPEGKDFLSLSRLVRCLEITGRTADDAVLTLKILFLVAAGRPTFPRTAVQLAEVNSFPVRIRQAGMRHTALAGRSVDKAAYPHIHHQTNRQENKQRGGTPVTH